MSNNPVLQKVFISNYTATDLHQDDLCFHWRIYNNNKSFKDIDRNKIIWDFKKTPTEIQSSPYLGELKNKAIETLADEMAYIFNTPQKKALLESYSFIPVPSSKTKDDINYDDRLIKLLHRVASLLSINIHICEPIHLKQSLVASHKSTGGKRLSVDALKDLYLFDQAKIVDNTKQIIVFDDVITKGTHFKAIQKHIIEKYSDAKIVGLFICQTQLV